MTVSERELVLDMMLKQAEGRLGHLILRETLDNYGYLEKSKRAFITRLYEGTTEKKLYLNYILDRFSKTPVKKMKPVIRILLETAVYQLFFMDKVPDRAAINEAVNLAKKRGYRPLSGFVNGVLRTIARNKETLPLPEKEKDPVRYYEVMYSMPDWLVRLFLEEEKEEAEALMRELSRERPLSIRRNPLKYGKDIFEKRLEEDGILLRKSDFLPDSYKMEGIDSLSVSKSFLEGAFYIQDESSQLAALLSGTKKGDTVIDLCAAPGGKSFILAEMAGESGKVVACDVSEEKRRLILENVLRLGIHNIRAEVNDAAVFNEAFVKKADVVFCDLPCSGLGVMGRKKDIRYLASPEKIKSLAALQRQILEQAKKYVKEGGLLIFSTCTLTEEENEENFRYLCEDEDFLPYDFSKELKHIFKKESPLSYLTEGAKQGRIKILPQYLESDGFFISKFIRKSGS